MKSLSMKLIMTALLAGMIAACSSGGGGFAGIGGSGYISSGSVSGFGSVFVNGVKFETDSAIFEVEDASGSQQDLRIGMVVQVSGTINPDGISGTATGIRYGDQLEGPVAAIAGSSVIEENADQTEKSFRVLGANVIINSVNTVFEGSGFDYDSIALNNHLEISGFYDQNSVLHATYVELKATIFNPASIVEIEGVIENLSGTEFTVRNVNVSAGSANISDFDNGLENGAYVEVKGTFANNTINATEVEKEEINYVDDGSEVSIEGYITRYVSASDFDIDGFRINGASAVLEPATLVLALGLKVEAEGAVSNGVLNATEIEAAEGDAEVHAVVSAVNAGAGTFTLDIASTSQFITVSVDTSTTLEDDALEIESFSLQNLQVGNAVEVVGSESGASSIVATKVKRISALEKTILQGMATAASGNGTAGTITILGVVFNYGGSTEFENESELSLDPAEISALINTINSTPTLLKIKDEDSDGLAEEIDLED